MVCPSVVMGLLPQLLRQLAPVTLERRCRPMGKDGTGYFLSLSASGLRSDSNAFTIRMHRE